MRILQFLEVFQKGSMTPFVARKKHAKVLATNCTRALLSRDAGQRLLEDRAGGVPAKKRKKNAFGVL